MNLALYLSRVRSSEVLDHTSHEPLPRFSDQCGQLVEECTANIRSRTLFEFFWQSNQVDIDIQPYAWNVTRNCHVISLGLAVVCLNFPATPTNVVADKEAFGSWRRLEALDDVHRISAESHAGGNSHQALLQNLRAQLIEVLEQRVRPHYFDVRLVPRVKVGLSGPKVLQYICHGSTKDDDISKTGDSRLWIVALEMRHAKLSGVQRVLSVLKDLDSSAHGFQGGAYVRPDNVRPIRVRVGSDRFRPYNTLLRCVKNTPCSLSFQ